MTTDIPSQWLRRKDTPEEFERAQLERTAAAFALPLGRVQEKFGARPFGTLTEKWRAVVQKLEPGDELWFFSSPSETFPQKLGCAGYAIVRAGAITDTLITLQT